MVKKVMEEKMAATSCCCEQRSPFVAIPAMLGGIFIVIVALFLIFARESAIHLIAIAWAFVVLGFFAMYFSQRSTKK